MVDCATLCAKSEVILSAHSVPCENICGTTGWVCDGCYPPYSEIQQCHYECRCYVWMVLLVGGIGSLAVNWFFDNFIWWLLIVLHSFLFHRYGTILYIQHNKVQISWEGHKKVTNLPLWKNCLLNWKMG